MKFTLSLTMLALPFLVAAGPLNARTDVCNSGSVHCCNGTDKSASALSSLLNGVVGITAPIAADVNAFLGIECSPLINLGTAGCKQQTVCCTGNQFNNNLVNLACSPVSVL